MSPEEIVQKIKARREIYALKAAAARDHSALNYSRFDTMAHTKEAFDLLLEEIGELVE